MPAGEGIGQCAGSGFQFINNPGRNVLSLISDFQWSPYIIGAGRIGGYTANESDSIAQICYCNKTPEKVNIKGKGSYWLMSSEVLVHGQAASWLQACGKAENHEGRSCKGKATRLMVDRK